MLEVQPAHLDSGWKLDCGRCFEPRKYKPISFGDSSVLGVRPAQLVSGLELGNSCSDSSFSESSLNSFLCEFAGPSRFSFWFQAKIDSGGISPGQPWETILAILQGRDSFRGNSVQRNFTYCKAFSGPLPLRWRF